MSKLPVRPYRFRRGEQRVALKRTLHVELLEARLLLSGSGIPRPTDGTTASLIASVASSTPVLTTIAVSPAKASVDCYTTQQFTAVGLDQVGNRLLKQPTFTWKASSGTITSTGLFTPSTRAGSVTITASSGSKRGTTTVTVFDAPPTVATPAAATVNSNGKTAAFSVLGADDGGEAKLRYTWAVTTLPKGAPAPTFSVNGSNAAENSTVTFGAVGTYSLSVTITDALGLSTKSNVTFAVQPIATTIIAVSPATVIVESMGTQQFGVTCTDQFGKSFTPQANVVWSATRGSITPAGLFTAPGPSGNAPSCVLSPIQPNPPSRRRTSFATNV